MPRLNPRTALTPEGNIEAAIYRPGDGGIRRVVVHICTGEVLYPESNVHYGDEEFRDLVRAARLHATNDVPF